MPDRKQTRCKNILLVCADSVLKRGAEHHTFHKGVDIPQVYYSVDTTSRATACDENEAKQPTKLLWSKCMYIMLAPYASEASTPPNATCPCQGAGMLDEGGR